MFDARPIDAYPYPRTCGEAYSVVGGPPPRCLLAPAPPWPGTPPFVCRVHRPRSHSATSALRPHGPYLPRAPPPLPGSPEHPQPPSPNSPASLPSLPHATTLPRSPIWPVSLRHNLAVTPAPNPGQCPPPTTHATPRHRSRSQPFMPHGCLNAHVGTLDVPLFKIILLNLSSNSY